MYFRGLTYFGMLYWPTHALAWPAARGWYGEGKNELCRIDFLCHHEKN